jgi:hypothetical protein
LCELDGLRVARVLLVRTGSAASEPNLPPDPGSTTH